jgi:hypothetical protein
MLFEVSPCEKIDKSTRRDAGAAHAGSYHIDPSPLCHPTAGAFITGAYCAIHQNIRAPRMHPACA